MPVWPVIRHSLHGHGSARAQHGAASLIVVMLLFFLMTLVAAYTSRNLIFEQRTSVNQYRSMLAFEAAEAGLEWALAQLNAGRISDLCVEPSTPTANTSFRQRYLDINPDTGMVGARKQGATTTPRRAGCVWTGTAWSCSCPTDTNPALTAPSGAGIYPAFWISFSTNQVTRPGVVQIVANGCTKVDSDCLSSTADSSNVESRALITSLVALKPAITSAPSAALTVTGQVSGGGALAAYNTAAERGGVTIRAGVGVPDISTFTLRSIPGTPASASVVAPDGSIVALQTGATDRMFAAVFGAWPDVYKLQPGAVLLNCPVAGCRQALSDAVAMNPDRVIWIEGDLTLESAGDVGSAPNPADLTIAGPAVIVATGNLVFTGTAAGGGVRLFGLIYTRSGSWNGSGEIQGAAFVEGNLDTSAAAPSIVFSGPVLDILRTRAGSFVRVPGGWRDFQ